MPTPSEYYISQYYTCEEIDERLLKGYYDDAVSKGYPGTLDELKVELASLDFIDLNLLNNNAGYSSFSDAITELQTVVSTVRVGFRIRYTNSTDSKLYTLEFISGQPTQQVNWKDISNIPSQADIKELSNSKLPGVKISLLSTAPTITQSSIVDADTISYVESTGQFIASNSSRPGYYNNWGVNDNVSSPDKYASTQIGSNWFDFKTGTIYIINGEYYYAKSGNLSKFANTDLATTSTAGLMSAEDKMKLDNISNQKIVRIVDKNTSAEEMDEYISNGELMIFYTSSDPKLICVESYSGYALFTGVVPNGGGGGHYDASILSIEFINGVWSENISTDRLSLHSETGSILNLTTTDRTNLVAAINELVTRVSALEQ